MAGSAPPSDAPASKPPAAATKRSPRWPWLMLLAFAVVELAGHFVVRARVPTDDDWSRAGALVREGLEPDDLVLTAPAWADPLMRRELGSALSLAQAWA